MSLTAKNSAKSSALSGNRKTGSPAGKISAISVGPVEPKKQKLLIWTEWNENDINAEKWEVGSKVKDSKSKPTSAPSSHGFEDPDPKFEWPYSIQSKIDSFRRLSDIYDKTAQIVDVENGLEFFDLITPNEHLHNSETIRWIISQIHTLWDICKKEAKTSNSVTAGSPPQIPETEPITNKALAAGRLWRPWEHIYAVNKVSKGPFIPAYNPYGKYAVRLYFMGTWRKIIIDDSVPVDEKGLLLLPQTTISGELWPLLLTKALLKIISLDFNSVDYATEFNDVSIISCLTGWLPEPLPLRFGHISETWKFLKETLPKYQWSEEKPKSQVEDDLLASIAAAAEHSDTKEEASCEKEATNKQESKSQKKATKDVKSAGGKDTKLDKHKKEVKDKKGKLTSEDINTEESFAPEFPEMVVFASFTDLPLNKLSASTEVADRRGRLRKYNLNHDFSNPLWITCTRDISLVPPTPPEKIPVWKTIRQKKKHVVPSDEPILTTAIKPEQWIELKSPYNTFMSSMTVPLHQTNHTNSRFSKMRSRPQTGIQGIEEIDEKSVTLEDVQSDSPIHMNHEKFTGKKQPADTVSTTRIATLGKKDRERSIDGIETTSKMGATIATNSRGIISSVNKMDEEGRIPKMNGGFTQENMIATSSLANHSTNEQVTDNSTGINYEPKCSSDANKCESKNKLWMDFDDFFVCFKSIIIYHKPSSFKYNEKYSELKQVTPQQKQEKKKDTTLSSHLTHMDEKLPRLLFIDSLMPIELIVSFASLSRWYEQKVEQPEKSNKISKKAESIITEHDAISLVDTTRELSPLHPGHLMAEPYSWKSLVTGQPLLRIHTTSIRSSFLSLPPGRHVLKFIISASVGYHINIVSNTKFAFGDEEEIMPKLTDESCRFVDQSLLIMRSLHEAIKSFTDPSRQAASIDLLFANVSPLTDDYITRANAAGSDSKLSFRNIHETFQSSLYEMLRKTLGESADAEMAFAWKTFMFDFNSVDIFALKEKRPETSSTNRGSAKKVDKKKTDVSNNRESNKSEKTTSSTATATVTMDKNTVEKEIFDERLEFWKNHIPTAEEQIAAIKIQSSYRAFYVRKLFQARNTETSKNGQVFETLRKSWSIVEQNLSENGLHLFRTMFKINPAIMQYYTFYKDEWNRISYVDYNSSYLDQPSNSWFILFRDVFYAQEKVLLLPKLYCSLNNCLLRVINNDTYKEIPKVFNKVSPYTYTKNKRGYTILAETRIFEQPISAGRWRLRLIGSSPSLIAPKSNKTEIISAFDSRETRDYYIPNENKTIMRYKVTVSEDHLTSLQLSTSKQDVYIKFSIYDNGDEVVSTIGKGVAVLPAFIFMKDRAESGPSRPDSKTFSSGRTSKAVEKNNSELKVKDNKSKRSSSANSNEIKDTKTPHSRSSSRQSLGPEADDDDQAKTHRYIIEASLLKDSWPLSPSNWTFINNLKENEAADMKNRALSPSKENKSTAENKMSALKANKAKAQKSKTPNPNAPSRPASSAFDITKPHWTLKWISDATCADAIEIKKDTDRIEEIKALKRAWENHEAGRAAKAMIVRADFLKSNVVKTDGQATDEEIDKQLEDDQQITVGANSGSTSSNITKANPAIAAAAATFSENSGKLKNKSDESKTNRTPKQKKDKFDSKAELVKAASEDLTAQQTNDIETAPIVEEILLNRPPTSSKLKVVLPPIDITPFIRSRNICRVFKDEEFEKQQVQMRKAEVEQYLIFKEQMLKFREEERKYRLNEKLKQIEECEVLQARLDASRKEVFDPREAFRQIFLDAERKRLEEAANQEASMAAQQKSDPKDKKKGSAGKGKKKK